MLFRWTLILYIIFKLIQSYLCWESSLLLQMSNNTRNEIFYSRGVYLYWHWKFNGLIYLSYVQALNIIIFLLYTMPNILGSGSSYCDITNKLPMFYNITSSIYVKYNTDNNCNYQSPYYSNLTMWYINTYFSVKLFE